MLTTKELVKAYMQRQGISSMYGVHKALNVPESTVRNWLKVGKVMSDETALNIAKILGLPPEWVLLSLAAERAFKGESYEQIKGIADRFQPPNFELPKDEPAAK